MAKKQSSKNVIKFLFGLWKVAPVCLTLQGLGQVSYSLLGSAIAPIFISRLLSSISNGSATFDNSVGLLIIYALILFIGNVVSPRISIALAYIGGSKIEMNLLGRVLRHLTSKSLGYHANKMSGGTVSNANKLAGAAERFWDTIMWFVIPTATSIISICIALSFMLWQYAVILAVLSIIFIVIAIKAQISVAKISEQVAKKSSKVVAYFADVISNISTVKAFAMADSELEKYRKKNAEWYNANIKEMKSVLLATGTFSVITSSMNICAFIAAIFATQHHIASIGIIYLILSYTINITRNLWDVSNATRNFIRVIGDASPMVETLCEDIEIKDPVVPEKLAIKNGAINFRNVTFTHDENIKPLFKKFSLNINPGEQIGLVGKSGSGKTSLTRILLRFSDIDNGEILIDGQNIANITQDELHRSIAYVSQEPILFHRTLRENIAYGKPNATNKEIRRAAEQANATEFIDTLSKGFNTLVGERGIKLSGGQRQRIAIARAILKDAPILILDEATSALDSETEKLIQDALAKLMQGRTCIVIAHRLSTIAKLDKIVVLDKGNIIEEGAHGELLAKDGVYANLWKRQSGGFIEE